MRKYLIIGFLVLFVLISGCSSAPERTTPQPTNTPPQITTPPPMQKAEVMIIDFAFFPAEATIYKGGTVTWMQKDGNPHAVIGSNFESPTLQQGQTFSRTYNEAGTFDYWCKFHSGERGKVIVK